MELSGWDVDLSEVYGRSLWTRRSQFLLRERMFESPDCSGGVLFFAIGEVGVNKQVAAVALFRGKAAPRLVWRSGRRLFWFEGAPGEPIAFSDDGGTARILEFLSGWDGRLGWRERILELPTARLLPPSSQLTLWERLQAAGRALLGR